MNPFSEKAVLITGGLGVHPVRSFGRPEEVAAAVLYLCSPKSGFTTGIALPVDGGVSA